MLEVKINMKDILSMDGRKLAPNPPAPWPTYARDKTVKVSSVKQAIEQFKIKGYTGHSSSGSLLGYLVSYCVENKIPFKLTHGVSEGKSIGYHMEVTPETSIPEVIRHEI